MQLQLLLRVALHSERCCAALHAITAFARYAAQHRDAIMQKFVVCEIVDKCRVYTAFDKLHQTAREHSRTLPAIITTRGECSWWRCNELHRDDRDAAGRLLPAISRNGENEYWIHGIKLKNNFIQMQINLIVNIALHSERCCAVLHAIPSFARYCVRAKSRIMQHFTVCNVSESQTVYTAFKKTHREERDVHGRILPAQIFENGIKIWYCNGTIHRNERDEHGRVLPAMTSNTGIKIWYHNGYIHRECRDEHGHILPARIYSSAIKFWFRRGKLHRTCRDARGRVLPAAITSVDKIWYCNDKPHRTCRDKHGHTLPAKITTRGDKFWYYRGKLHRTCRDARGRVLPAVIFADGRKFWYRKNALHRTDCDDAGLTLPAYESANAREWRYHGNLHRSDRDTNNDFLPAVIAPGRIERWIHGKKIE